MVDGGDGLKAAAKALALVATDDDDGEEKGRSDRGGGAHGASLAAYSWVAAGVRWEDDAGGDADGARVVGDVGEDDGVGADGSIVADADGAKELGAGANVDPVADLGRAAQAAVAEAHGDAVAEDAVVAEAGVATNDDAANVLDDEATTDPDFAGEFGAEERDREELEQLVEGGDRGAQGTPRDGVAPAAEAVDEEHPESVTG